MNLKRRVSIVCAAIPSGCVASYGQIAALCGAPRAARQVGRALAGGASENAHRVLNSAGFLSGAEAFVIAGLQRQMLEEEGVAVSDPGRVDMRVYRWEPDEEESTAFFAIFSQLEI